MQRSLDVHSAQSVIASEQNEHIFERLSVFL